MIRNFLIPPICSFWASPHDSMTLMEPWRTTRTERNALAALKVLVPGFPRDDPAEPPPRSNPQIPTDVPVPEPKDVPAPEPIDVPAPEPGGVPPATQVPRTTP